MSGPTLGIIAEYNPLHLGHLYQIETVKSHLAPAALVVIMSGDFTQRGIPAVMEKYERAALAIAAGADLVIELPTLFATSSAADFARGGISLLNATGMVDMVCFGAERADKEKFFKIANLLLDEPDAFKTVLNDSLKKGLGFAPARQRAIEACLSNDYGEFIKTPNNILGTEYVLSLLSMESDMDFYPIERNMDFSSSSHIRQNLLSTDPDVSGMVPDFVWRTLDGHLKCNSLVFLDDLSEMLHLALLSVEDYEMFFDTPAGLSGRIKKYRDTFVSTGDFIEVLKTKNITHSHVSRSLTHILLGIKNSHRKMADDLNFAPYINVLGVRDSRRDLLGTLQRKSKVPVFTSHGDALLKLKSLPKEKELFSIDQRALDIHRVAVTHKSGKAVKNPRFSYLVHSDG